MPFPGHRIADDFATAGQLQADDMSHLVRAGFRSQLYEAARATQGAVVRARRADR